jgi:hypothetical protein
MRTLLKTLSAAGMVFLIAGCATRTVTVVNSQSDVVRLGADVSGHVYTYRDGKWQDAGKMKLPAGWFAGPWNGK